MKKYSEKKKNTNSVYSNASFNNTNEMHDNMTADKEEQIKKFKRKVESWREILLSLNSILLWEKQWYPGLILSVTTTIFFAIWILEPTFLTLISLFLLVIAFVDYLVPLVTSKSSNWTGPKEKKLDEICHRLYSIIFQLQKSWKFLLATRTNWPTLYYGSIGLCFGFLAWLGNAVNNLLLLYICVNALLLTPGLKHKKRIQTGIKTLYSYVINRKIS